MSPIVYRYGSAEKLRGIFIYLMSCFMCFFVPLVVIAEKKMGTEPINFIYSSFSITCYIARQLSEKLSISKFLPLIAQAYPLQI